MNYVLPNITKSLTIVAGFTQTGIPLLRQNEGSGAPTIIVCDSSGAAVSADISGTVQTPDASPGNTTFSVSVGGTATPGNYVVGVDQGGTITDGFILTVTPPASETDVIGSLSGLPAQVPFTG